MEGSWLQITLAAWIPVVLAAVIWLIPLLLTVKSKKVFGQERKLWIVAVAIFCWPAYIAFLICAPFNKSNN
jgi:hypothetical protein